MSKTFEDAVTLIINIEGPSTNDPNDPGGLTRFGIAQNEHPDINVASLTYGQAKIIYRMLYWDVNNLNDIPYMLALPTFDMGVDQGVRTAALLLQRTLAVTQDGVIGPQTQALAKIASMDVLYSFMASRALAYTRDAKFSIYGRGWLKRCFRISSAATGG